MTMKLLGDLLKKQMGGSVVWKAVEASLVVDEANIILKEILGAEIQKFARALYLKNKILAITCLSSVAAQEIRLNERTIIEKLKNKFGKQTVERIRYLA